MSTITGYFRFEQLSDEVKSSNNIRSKARLDCVQYAGDYKGLTNFVNAKGQLFFYLTPARDLVNSDSKRIAEFALTNNSQNLSSIYIHDLDYSYVGYGYPNANRLLSNGQTNPMFKYRNDGFLFIVNETYTIVNMYVLPDCRNLMSLICQAFPDGGLDSEIDRIEKQAKPLYNYAAYSNLFSLTK